MRILVKFSIVLALSVVILGAYTRLTDAGLGCPDWPGCYGHMLVPNESQLETAQARFPQQAIEPEKAWNEMIHRYFAGTLGLAILMITILAFRHQYPARIKKFSLGLLALVCFQAALGMWTVTLVLMPAVVMAHLLGGFSIFILLILLGRHLKHNNIPASSLTKLPKGGWLVLFIVTFQIALGGWTSSNYAALACTELPICESGWQQRLDFNAFHLISPQADTYQYGVLDYSARMTIHIGHRFWAVVTVLSLIFWSAFIFKRLAQTRAHWTAHHQSLFRINFALLAILAIQFSLGIANVVLSLPISVAVMHNAFALILLTVFVLNLYYCSLCQFSVYEKSVVKTNPDFQQV